MKFTLKEKQYVIDKLLEKVYQYLDDNDIAYREVNKPKETWIALCTIQGTRKYISYNAHIKKGFHSFRRIAKPFVILHEIGHMFDTAFNECKETGTIKKDEFEKTADEYVFTFCDEHLSLMEFYVLDSFITGYSRIKRIYRKEEMEEIKEQYKAFKETVKRELDAT